MKEKDIKKVFDNINANEETKSRILNNIYEKNQQVRNNKWEIIYMKNKKIISMAAASVVLVGGIFLYNNKENMENSYLLNPASSSPPLNQEYVKEEEFNNFNLQNLRGNIEKIKIKNHENSYVFKEISNEKFINNTLNFLENTKEKDIKYEDYKNEEERLKAYKVLEAVGTSQATGNSIVLSFVTKDGVNFSTRVNLDLDMICINEKYYDVSYEFINSIKKELKDVKNFDEMNKPPQG